jgi:cellulose synthase/poly-beta-1,6-N-acetylglucosamine synthase-like glycosyltransferase
MTTIQAILAAGFWCSTSAIFYTYVGYPIVAYVLSRAFGREAKPPEVADAHLPSAALLIVAHNEEDVIEERLRNALALEYPRDRFEILVASDASDDATAEIVRRFGPRVRLLDFRERRGKADTLGAALAQVQAQIVVLSDANTSMEPESARRLARWFADPGVGAVCGRLVLSDRHAGGSGTADTLYWRYETFLKRSEARLGALLGANGGIYAIRRSQFIPLPPGTVVDDFVIPLAAKLRTGCRIVYDPESRANEETAPNLSGEFRRRARIGVGGFQSLGILWPLLSPRHGWTAFAFWSHKVARWICPFFLIGALVTSLALAQRPFFGLAFLVQALFYAFAALGAGTPGTTLPGRLMRACSFFVGMNLALLVGFTRWLRGRPTGVWARTERVQGLGQAA